jgi:hypothetical protein
MLPKLIFSDKCMRLLNTKQAAEGYCLTGKRLVNYG